MVGNAMPSCQNRGKTIWAATRALKTMGATDFNVNPNPNPNPIHAHEAPLVKTCFGMDIVTACPFEVPEATHKAQHAHGQLSVIVNLQ